MATQEAPIRTPSRFLPKAAAAAPSEIHVLENPLALQDRKLAHAAEEEIRRALQDERLGTLQVRFRVCSDADEGLRFVCKVENPARAPFEGSQPAWRWWSPLLASAEDLRAALADGLKVREQRLASSRNPAA